MTRTPATVAIGILLTMATSARQRPAGALAPTHVNVVDVSGGAIRSDTTVVVVDRKITVVAPADRARVPADAQVVDAAGKFLIPGL